MKRLFSIALMGALVFSTGVLIPAQTKKPRARMIPLKNIRAIREKGGKVKERVEQLRRKHPCVTAALQEFEMRGHKPRFEDAVSIRGTIDIPREVALLRHHHASPQDTVVGDGVEIIFITVVDLWNEWQGTAIANFYDSSGSLQDQYVADVVITRSDYYPYEWTARYDLKFEADGVGYINHRPGMFTNFLLGTPVQQQNAPLNLLPSQFISTEQSNVFYDLFPDQLLYDAFAGGGDGGGQLPLIQTRFARPAQNYLPPNQLSQQIRNSTTLVGWGGMARDVGIGGMGAAGMCTVSTLLTRGGAAGPCLAGTMTGVVIVSAFRNLRVVNGN